MHDPYAPYIAYTIIDTRLSTRSFESRHTISDTRLATHEYRHIIADAAIYDRLCIAELKG